MLIFLDTVDVKAIEMFVGLRVVDGITTNPSLLAHAKLAPIDCIKKILTIFPHGTINIEITESQCDKAYAQALKIRELGDNVVVKIPAHISYIPLIRRLIDEKIPVNTTLVFSVVQAVLMGKLGVQYISPFIGRLDDSGVDGITVLKDIINAYAFYGFSTTILAASLRTVDHINRALTLGVDSITVSPALLVQACSHLLTEQGIAKFTQDWQEKGRSLL